MSRHIDFNDIFNEAFLKTVDCYGVVNRGRNKN
jgi:hypothetical protein